MASVTGIELGRESCVLVGVRASGAGVAEVMALHMIEPGAWPTLDVALIETLRSVRRGKRFPRNARIVAWGLPDDPAGNEATLRALQRPILAAGFRVESVLTPPQALALLAASRPRLHAEGAVAWLALNMHGAAIAIVRAGELLFARTFEWSYSTRVMSGKAQLLQRYSLVAQLAPEVRRGIAAVRAGRGIIVEQAVTCGDLPELRSLTMPLIEELDLEVETLDSTEGLRAVGKAKAERFAESAPAIRLACAAALTRPKRRGSANKSFARVAAGIAVIAALGWGSYAYWRGSTALPGTPQVTLPPNTPVSSAARQRAGGPPGAARGPAKAAGNPQVMAQGPSVPKPGVSASPASSNPPPAMPPNPAAAQPSRATSDPKITQPAARSGAPGTLAPPGQTAAPKPAPVAKVESKPTGTAIVTPPAKADPKPITPPLATALPKTTTTIVPPPKADPKPIAAPANSQARSTRPPIVTAPTTAEPRPAPKPVATPPAKPAASASSRKVEPPAASASSRNVEPRPVNPPPATRAAPPVTASSSKPVERPVNVTPRAVEPPAGKPSPRPVEAPPNASKRPVEAPSARAAKPIAPPPASTSTPAVEPPASASSRAVRPPSASASTRTAEPPVVSAGRRPVEPPVVSAARRAVEPPVVSPPSRRVESRSSRAAPAPDRPLPPLRVPLPKVDSILIDQERRLAIIDGTIVTIGDSVGPRVVVQIERDGVVLREPSGLSVRVALRFKTL